MTRIAGVVVLYDPPSGILERIETYRNQVEVLFAIDNSERVGSRIQETLEKLGNVVYQWNGRNLGIARALNTGAALAIQRGCDFLLMMDQDSEGSPTLVEELLRAHSDVVKFHVGILYAYHEYQNYHQRKGKDTVSEIFLADTAGTLLDLQAYRKAGSFLEDLFIDYVDFEYCLRLHSKGFTLWRVNNATIYQRLGNLSPAKFLWWKVGVSNHTPIRMYYRIRNRLVVARNYFKYYPAWSLKEFILTPYVLVKMLAFEEHRWEKTKMAGRGIRDFALGRLGKYQQA